MLSLKNVKNSDRNLRNPLIFYDARNAYSMSDTGTSPCISFHFFQPSYRHKVVCFLNSWKQIVKTLVRKHAWLIELSFGRNNLIHALEKRYYHNKTQLRYNFGSVDMIWWRGIDGHAPSQRFFGLSPQPFLSQPDVTLSNCVVGRRLIFRCTLVYFCTIPLTGLSFQKGHRVILHLSHRRSFHLFSLFSWMLTDVWKTGCEFHVCYQGMRFLRKPQFKAKSKSVNKKPKWVPLRAMKTFIRTKIGNTM